MLTWTCLVIALLIFLQHAGEEEKVKLSSLEFDEAMTVPAGYHW